MFCAVPWLPGKKTRGHSDEYKNRQNERNKERVTERVEWLSEQSRGKIECIEDKKRKERKVPTYRKVRTESVCKEEFRLSICCRPSHVA